MAIGIQNGRLSPCPDRNNCVSSDAEAPEQRIEPLCIAGDADQAWAALRRVVRSRPRTEVVADTADYLHAVEKSRLFKFTDDLEFHLRKTDGIIAIRSASRRGYSDFGVNRRRLEEIRTTLQDAGVLCPAEQSP